MNSRTFIKDIKALKTFKNKGLIALHKPILLLYVLSKLHKGYRSNEFPFEEIETPVKELLKLYGWKNTKTYKAQYPFYFLSSSDFWRVNLDKSELKNPDSPSCKEMKGRIGSLDQQLYDELVIHPERIIDVITILLSEYWPDSLHSEILDSIGVHNEYEIKYKAKRATHFVEDVLKAYERKCAICGQSIRLRDTLIGIDACHVKPIQYYGDDDIRNGIALCKFHHWALDRGAISFDSNLKVIVSSEINGLDSDEYLTNFEGQKVFQSRKADYHLSGENIEWHREHIFIH